MREKTVEWALKEKIIAIVRGMEAKDCLRVAQALYDGGIRLMEITYDQRDPAQWAKTADAIGKIAEAFEGRMLVGAGTVTTPELVTRTRDAGGQFIISPDTNPAVIARTRELELVSMPGAMTPSEILAAHAAGADLVKLFPAAALGSAYLKAVRSPISHVRIMAVGGIMNLSFEKVLLMQTDSNTAVSEVISTYVYKLGIQRAQYSLSAAVGLFNNIINLILLVTVNKVSRKISETSLW